MKKFINWLTSSEVKNHFIQFYSGMIDKQQMLSILDMIAYDDGVDEMEEYYQLYYYLLGKAKKNGFKENIYSSNSSLVGIYDEDVCDTASDAQKVSKALKHIRKKIDSIVGPIN